MDKYDKKAIYEKYNIASRRLLLLDYDGTLVHFRSIPEKVRLSEKFLAILEDLTINPLTYVYIITGRSIKDIESLLTDLQIGIIAEHGAFYKTSGDWQCLFDGNTEWQETIIKIMEGFVIENEGSYVEKKSFSLAWHYRRCEPESGQFQARRLIEKLEKLIPANDLKLLDGKKVVEIMPMRIGKGNAISELYGNSKYDFILAIGDDKTDEEMFEYLGNKIEAITIKVGKGISAAKYHLKSQTEVESFLKHISG